MSNDTIRTKIVGVTYKNADGTDRQKLLAKCREDDALKLQREPNNAFDANAIKSRNGARSLFFTLSLFHGDMGGIR